MSTAPLPNKPEDRLLIAVGRLTLAFSELDLLISDFTMLWLRCENADLSEHVVRPMTTTGKLDVLSWLVAYHAENFYEDDGVQEMAHLVTQAALRVKELVNIRNDVVHGIVSHRDGPGRRRFWNFSKDRSSLSAEPADVEAFVRQMEDVANDFDLACVELEARMSGTPVSYLSPIDWDALRRRVDRSRRSSKGKERRERLD